MSNPLRPHGLQHTRLPCPSPTPRACSNSCPSSQWCHPTIPSSVNPFSSSLQSFPVSGSFQMSQVAKVLEFQASASVLPMNIQDWLPLGKLDLLVVQGTLNSLLQHHSSKSSVLRCSAFFIVQLSHPYMTTGKTMLRFWLGLHWIYNHLKIINVTYFFTYLGIIDYLLLIFYISS